MPSHWTDLLGIGCSISKHDNSCQPGSSWHLQWCPPLRKAAASPLSLSSHWMPGTWSTFCPLCPRHPSPLSAPSWSAPPSLLPILLMSLAQATLQGILSLAQLLLSLHPAFPFRLFITDSNRPSLPLDCNPKSRDRVIALLNTVAQTLLVRPRTE